MSTFDLVLPRAYGAKHAAPARAGYGEEKDEMRSSFVFSLTSRSQCRALVLGYRARVTAASVAVPSYLSAGLLACMLTCVLAFAAPVAAQVVAGGDYVLDQRVRGADLQSCVATGVYDVAGQLRVGMFLGSGPGFTGNGQEIVFLTNSGAEFVVATGLNSIGDCAYDASGDVLYVSDNGLEALGSISGDTLFAITDASTAWAVSVAGLELLTAGDIGAAAGVVVDSAGAVYVSDSIGGGSGRVLKIDTGGVSEWITGLDFASGLAFNAIGELFVADTSSSTFQSTVRRYDSAGSLIGAFSGPTFIHGSFDLAFNPAGTHASSADLLVSGAASVVSLDTAAVTTTFASGFGFSTGISVDPITSAVTIVSSAFPPTVENRTLFRFTPRSELFAGKGGAKGECIAEISGAKLVAKKPGKKPKDARCTDGDPVCDADGAINGACLFRFGLCLNVTDTDFPACFASRVDTIDVSVRPKKLPLPVSLAQWNAALVSALPITSETCSESDGVKVVLRQNKKGKAKPGKLRIKVEVRRDDAKPKKDTDKIKLVCLPAGA